MNDHFTRFRKRAQFASLIAAALLLVPIATWAQTRAAQDEGAEPSEPATTAQGETQDSADRGSKSSPPAETEAPSAGRQSEDSAPAEDGRETSPPPRRRPASEPDGEERRGALEREIDREQRGEPRELEEGRDSNDGSRRTDDRRDFGEPRDFDERRDFDRAQGAGRRGPANRQAGRDMRRADGGDFRVEDLRGPDLGLWFQRGTRDGLVIANVAGSGAIAQFGFREGDRIVSVNGRRVVSERDFVNFLFSDDIVYERVPVVVLRDGRRRLIYVRPDVFVSQTAAVDPLDRFGIVLDDRYTDRIVVWRVLPRSPAYYAGIRAGDVLTTFDGYRIADAGDLVRLIQSAGYQNVAVDVSRDQQSRELYVDLAIAEPVTQERTSRRTTVEEPIDREGVFDDIRSVDPSTTRRLRPRPDVPPGMRIPGGEVGRERGPIAPTGAEGGTPTTPMRIGFPR